MTKDKKYKDADWLHQKYIEEGLSERKVADLTTVSRTVVRKHLDKNDIQRRPCPSEKPPQFVTMPNGYEVVMTKIDGESKTVGMHQLLAIADGAEPEKVFSGGDYHVHHENDVPWYNIPENLTLMSREEHSKVTNEKVTDEEIKKMTQNNSQYYAAQELGVSQSTISRRVNKMCEEGEAR